MTAMFTLSYYLPARRRETMHMENATSMTMGSFKDKIEHSVCENTQIFYYSVKTLMHSLLGTSSPSSYEEEWVPLTHQQQSYPGKGQ